MHESISSKPKHQLMPLRYVLNRLLKTKRTSRTSLIVDEPICIVGDIHGQLDILQRLMRKLDDIAPQARRVFVGDYIDRGPDSASVLKFLENTCRTMAKSPVCLLGNHEEMLLNFLKFPQEDGNRWIRHGGLQTMSSFGVTGLDENNDSATLLNARDTLLKALDPTLIAWLETLPRWWQTGNVAVVHAGADPTLPMSEQTNTALTWGHPDFGIGQRNDGLWVARGHAIVETPTCTKGVISVDTGAYATGRLTAAVIDDGIVTFVEG